MTRRCPSPFSSLTTLSWPEMALTNASSNSVTVAGSGNLIQDNFGCPGVVQLGVDPQLDLLNLNPPGDTPTMALLSGSTAIGQADPNAAPAIITDQRGVQRKQTPDIGAYETAPPTADLSLTKAVSTTTAQPGDTITYTLVLTNKGPNDANSVSVTDALPTQLTFGSCTADAGGVCTFSSG